MRLFSPCAFSFASIFDAGAGGSEAPPEGMLQIIDATVDPADLHKDIGCQLAVLGDAKLVLAALIDEVRRVAAGAWPRTLVLSDTAFVHCRYHRVGVRLEFRDRPLQWVEPEVFDYVVVADGPQTGRTPEPVDGAIIFVADRAKPFTEATEPAPTSTPLFDRGHPIGPL